MSTSAESMRFDDDAMWVALADGHVLGVPLAWFPRPLHASPAERAAVTLTPFCPHWEALDEDVSIVGLLAGRGTCEVSGMLPGAAGGKGAPVSPVNVARRVFVNALEMDD